MTAARRLRFLLCFGLGNVRGAGDAARDRFANRAQLTMGSRRLGFEELPPGLNEMVDTDGIDVAPGHAGPR